MLSLGDGQLLCPVSIIFESLLILQEVRVTKNLNMISESCKLLLLFIFVLPFIRENEEKAAGMIMVIMIMKIIVKTIITIIMIMDDDNALLVYLLLLTKMIIVIII